MVVQPGNDIDASATGTPILPAHIEETVAAITKLHEYHQLQKGALQRLVEQLTALIGRPGFISGMAVVVVAWIAANAAVSLAGGKPWDAAPFAWLQGVIGLLALYVTVLILTTQRREDQLAGYREQLTLELAILGEQKLAKIIALLEEMRHDSPTLKNRVDEEAAAMSVAADPQAVLDAIKETEVSPLVDELMTTPNPELDPLAVDRVRAEGGETLGADQADSHAPRTQGFSRVAP